MKPFCLSNPHGLMAADEDAKSAAGSDAKATTTVKVLVASLCEGGEFFTKDQTFKTTPKRAKALGDTVEITG